VPKEIVKTMTAAWAMDLAEFYYSRERRKEPIEPKVLYGVWQNWLKADGEWPSGFQLELDAINRARSAVKVVKAVPERKVVSKSALPSETPTQATRSALEDIPSDLLPELLDAALTELMDETKSAPLKELLRKRGTKSAAVEIRAREISARG
jgi:hypothetical protein